MTTIKFIEPKVKSVKPIYKIPGKVSSYEIILDWGKMGIGVHNVSKVNNLYQWTDPQSPIPVRRFNSIRSLMWEYELPSSLEQYLKNL
jgi:hypothetical protein